MAVAFKFRIGDLIAEFLTHASVFLGALQPAGTVAFLFEQSLADARNDLFVFIKTYFHTFTLLIFDI
jgi:hypothetical protein